MTRQQTLDALDEYIAALRADLAVMRGGPNVQGVADRERELAERLEWRRMLLSLPATSEG